VIFFDFTWLSHPRHYRGILDVCHSPGGFLEKFQPVTEKVPFDGLWGRLCVMKRKIKAVLEGCDNSGEKSK
jgi:hypothetical protein